MKSKINRNMVVWITLVVLSSISMMSPSRMMNSYLLLTLLLITVVKVSLLCYEFMEMREAHKAWLITVVSIMVISAGLIFKLHY